MRFQINVRPHQHKFILLLVGRYTLVMFEFGIIST